MAGRTAVENENDGLGPARTESSCGCRLKGPKAVQTEAKQAHRSRLEDVAARGAPV